MKSVRMKGFVTQYVDGKIHYYLGLAITVDNERKQLWLYVSIGSNEHCCYSALSCSNNNILIDSGVTSNSSRDSKHVHVRTLVGRKSQEGTETLSAALTSITRERASLVMNLKN